jgi:hypothetical protein
MYLNETMKLMDQKMRERTPITFSRLGATLWCPLKHSLMAYSGLVPMSPYTTPSAVKASAASALPVGGAWVWVDDTQPFPRRHAGSPPSLME